VRDDGFEHVAHVEPGGRLLIEVDVAPGDRGLVQVPHQHLVLQRLRGKAIRGSDAEMVIRRADAELGEENVAQLRIVVLSRMDQDVRAEAIQRFAEAAHLAEVAARTRCALAEELVDVVPDVLRCLPPLRVLAILRRVARVEAVRQAVPAGAVQIAVVLLITRHGRRAVELEVDLDVRRRRGDRARR